MNNTNNSEIRCPYCNGKSAIEGGPLFSYVARNGRDLVFECRDCDAELTEAEVTR